MAVVPSLNGSIEFHNSVYLSLLSKGLNSKAGKRCDIMILSTNTISVSIVLQRVNMTSTLDTDIEL